MGFHVFEATVPPPPLPDNKVRRGYYTRSVLCDAVKQVMLGAMTVTQASRHYKIPRTTIHKHFSKAREQHSLKEMYIRRMQTAEKREIGRVPESDHHRGLHEETERLVSYGTDVWPSSSGEEESTTSFHWRSEPVRVDPVPARSCGQADGAYSLQSDMVIAEQCEVTSDEGNSSESTDLVYQQHPVRSLSTASIPARPLTRIVLKREGSDDIVKEIAIPRLFPVKRSVFSSE